MQKITQTQTSKAHSKTKCICSLCILSVILFRIASGCVVRISCSRYPQRVTMAKSRCMVVWWWWWWLFYFVPSSSTPSSPRITLNRLLLHNPFSMKSGLCVLPRPSALARHIFMNEHFASSEWEARGWNQVELKQALWSLLVGGVEW